MPITVKLSVSAAHTLNIPSGTEELISETIERGGIKDGEFKTFLGPNIDGSCSKKGAQVAEFQSESNSFIINTQPRSNNTRHRCTVFFPPELQDSAYDLYSDILKASKEKKLKKTKSATNKSNGKDDAMKNNPTPDDKWPVQLTPIVRPVTLDKVFNGTKQTIDSIEGEPLAFMLSEIYRKHGIGWVSKTKIFACFREMKMTFPEAVLIRILINTGYLESNEGKVKLPHSRISTQGLDVLKNYEKTNGAIQRNLEDHVTENTDTVKCSDAVIVESPTEVMLAERKETSMPQTTSKIAAIMDLAKQHDMLQDKAADLELILCTIHEKIDLQRQIIEAMEREAKEKEAELGRINAAITPQMHKAKIIVQQMEELEL